MNFLITGNTGFVGKHLESKLLEEGHNVIGINSSNCSLLDKDKLKHLFDNNSFDGIFHLASLTHPPTSFVNPSLFFEVNAVGTINLIELMPKECCIMQCSTPEVYGICPEGIDIKEDFPLRPMNPYGVSKAAADLYILERSRNTQLKAFITRAGSHTGPFRPSNYSISSDAIQIAKILKGQQDHKIRVGNLNSQRAVLDVRDVCNAYIQLMFSFIEGNIESGEIFHISGDEPKSMAFYLDTMLNLFDLKVDKEIDSSLVRKIDIPYQKLNNDKVKQVINWNPKLNIETTLKDLVNYWMENL